MSEKNQFTIATYNIEYGVNAEKIITNISQMANSGVDIFCLQEISNVGNKEFIVNTILKDLGDEWDAKYHVGDEISKTSIGTAILWNKKKLTIKKHEKILLPKIKKFDLHEKLYYRIIGVEGIPLQRKALSCIFSFDQHTIRVSCVHVDNVGGPTQRMKQVSFLISHIKSMEKVEQEIICGDFNTFDLLKTGYEKKLLQKKLGNEFVDASKKVNWTSDIYMIDFRTSVKIFPWIIKTFNIHIRRRLDYIWIKNFEVKECKKWEMQGSDHFPVVAKLLLNHASK